MGRTRTRSASNVGNNTTGSSRGEVKMGGRPTSSSRRANTDENRARQCSKRKTSISNELPSPFKRVCRVEIEALQQKSSKAQNGSVNLDTEESCAASCTQSCEARSVMIPSAVKNQLTMDDSSDSGDSESDGVEWEDVQEVEIKGSMGQENSDTEATKAKPLKAKNVEISIQIPGRRKGKRQRTREDIQKYIQRIMNRSKKEVQEGMHKVHILLLIAHGFHRNSICNNCFIQAWSLSLVPVHLISLPVKHWDVAQLDNLLYWFLNGFPHLEEFKKEHIEVTEKLGKFTMSEIFVSLLRAVGLLSRLVLSLQPVPLKIGPDRTSPKASRGAVGEKSKRETRERKSAAGTKCGEKTVKTPRKGTKKSIGKTECVKQEMGPGPSGITDKELEELKVSNNQRVKKQDSSVKITKDGTKRGLRSDKETLKIKRLKRKRKNVNYSFTDSGDNSDVGDESQGGSEDEYMDSGESSNVSKNAGKHKASKAKRKKCFAKKPTKTSVNKKSSTLDLSDSDSDFEEESHAMVPHCTSSSALSDSGQRFGVSVKTKTSKTTKGKRPAVPNNVKRTRKNVVLDLKDDDSDFEESSRPLVPKQLSTTSIERNSVQIMDKDDGQSSSTKNTSRDIDSWTEVYLPYEEKWICVHLESSSVNHPELCESHSTCPLVYVLAFDRDGCVKDLTSRYASNWMSKNRKMRVDADWLARTLLPYKSRNRALEEDEDAYLQVQQLEKPLPLSIGEYKKHPLYAVKRHLLKFEAIYPESATILGYCRSEAVYSRDCVRLLHTREKWLNEALVVKEGEKPYKIVKGRVKRNQPVRDPNSVTIELFGKWQTEQYKPPPAKDGKVPRNEYGNIEMFQPSMLPPGARHIQIPGIQRVARKLGIDCAPAVVGFDFHCGFSHPVIDGVVVCEEFEDTLRDAWREEEQETKRKKEEKRLKRVLDNWKLLVKTVLIRERLKKRYNTEEPKANPDCDEAVDDLTSVAWPLNMQEHKTTVDKAGHCHVFPTISHKQDAVTGEWTKACACGFTLPFEKM